mmetsp:Transcript_88348/g.250343  ORF Transcript_88348/g.250343 Transcript_88348/m.250343 type:complete len:224 (+) Transcript_88348:28-699(+)|eukprot:CAMPEP_0168365490 /NCGR_PEP_ID=MMETSP0228-20121227/4745_1 /TAXON_ID=133427 /ORGANISM="Protoceratium reticulatum, Strain CCCM 535 (=CCMP 1889)" /LENGTH=223 /DNA_ID=CAMNT_0008378273 /DNA_START=27 /DNA_END=698 /DNA_ORIENTATION=+
MHAAGSAQHGLESAEVVLQCLGYVRVPRGRLAEPFQRIKLPRVGAHLGFTLNITQGHRPVDAVDVRAHLPQRVFRVHAGRKVPRRRWQDVLARFPAGPIRPSLVAGDSLDPGALQAVVVHGLDADGHGAPPALQPVGLAADDAAPGVVDVVRVGPEHQTLMWYLARLQRTHHVPVRNLVHVGDDDPVLGSGLPLEAHGQIVPCKTLPARGTVPPLRVVSAIQG